MIIRVPLSPSETNGFAEQIDHMVYGVTKTKETMGMSEAKKAFGFEGEAQSKRNRKQNVFIP